jgi:hypothetical protein
MLEELYSRTKTNPEIERLLPIHVGEIVIGMLTACFVRAGAGGCQHEQTE